MEAEIVIRISGKKMLSVLVLLMLSISFSVREVRADQYTLHIYDGYNGHTDPAGGGDYLYDPDAEAYVTAYPDEGYNFDFWLI